LYALLASAGSADACNILVTWLKDGLVVWAGAVPALAKRNARGKSAATFREPADPEYFIPLI
jgi:hypothetical protein